MRGIVAHHLRTSAHHQMAADEANLLALDENRTIIIEDYETFEDREAARRDAAIAKRRPQKKGRSGSGTGTISRSRRRTKALDGRSQRVRRAAARVRANGTGIRTEASAHGNMVLAAREEVPVAR